MKDMEDDMSNIFIGLLFIFLDFNFKLGSSTIELIPDFIGYILMLNGLKELAGESSRFEKVIPYTKGMVIYTIIVYIIDVIGFSSSTGLAIIPGIISVIVSLYISHEIIFGIKDIESLKGWELNSDSLFNTWRYLVIANIASYVLLIVPILAIISIIFTLIITISYLVSFNNTKNLYNSYFVG